MRRRQEDADTLPQDLVSNCVELFLELEFLLIGVNTKSSKFISLKINFYTKKMTNGISFGHRRMTSSYSSISGVELSCSVNWNRMKQF